MKMHNEPIQDHHVKMFNEMKWYEQYLIVFPWIRTILFPALPTILGFVSALIFRSPLPLFFGVVGTIAYLFSYLETVKPVPKTGGGGEAPQFGLLEFLGRRLPVVIDEGLTIGLPFGRIVRRSKEVINKEVLVTGIGCRLEASMKVDTEGKPVAFDSFFESVQFALSNHSPANITVGGSMRFQLGVTLERNWRDGWSMIDYDNAGETETVLKIIQDRLQEDLREVGKRLTWTQANFSTDLIAVHLITALTGQRSFRGTTDILRDATPELIREFIDDVKLNGRSYIGGLGIRIRRLQVASAIPEGKLASEAEQVAVEELRRIGMLKNAEGVAAAVSVYKDKLGQLSDRDILNALLVNDPDARFSQNINTIDIRGLENLNLGKAGEAVAKIVSQFVDKKRN